MADKLEARLGLNNEDFLKGLEKVIGGFGRFGKELLGVGSVAGLGMVALNGLKNAFLDTAQGMEIMNTATKMSKQYFKELLDTYKNFDITKPDTWFPNLSNVFKAKEFAKDDIAFKERQWQWNLANTKQQNIINQLMYEANDREKTLGERIEKLREAKEKIAKLTDDELIQIDQKIKKVRDELSINSTSMALKEELNKLEIERVEIANKVVENRRLESLLTGLIVQQQKELNEQIRLGNMTTSGGNKIEAISGVKDIDKSKYNTRWQDMLRMPTIGNLAAFGTPKLKTSLAKSDEAMLLHLRKELTDQQIAVMKLSDTFANFFSGVNLGFQSMIDGVITGIKRLVAELIAKAVILSILSAITGVPMGGGNFTKMLFNGFGNPFGGGSGTGGYGGGLIALGSMPGGNSDLRFKISGKDLVTVISRNA